MAVSDLPTFFPYSSIRPQQEEIIDFINKCMINKQTAIIEAATGVGKTIAALSPLIEYLLKYNESVENKEDKMKLLILGRTHSQSDRIIEEVKEIVDISKVKLAAVSKRGKQALCLHKEVKYQPSSQFQSICTAFKKNKSCVYFKNSLNPSKTDFVKTIIDLPLVSSEIIDLSDSNGCCPAEITNLLIKQADIISGAYHYLFSSKIKDMFLNSLDIPPEQLILVVDECHNLQDASISMNTITLSLNQIKNSIVEIERTQLSDEKINIQRKEISPLVYALKIFMENELGESDEKLINPLPFIHKIEDEMKKLGSLLMITPELIAETKKLSIKIGERLVTKHFLYLDFVLEALEFTFQLMTRDDSLLILSKNGNNTTLQMKILDPSKEISQIIKMTHFSVLMTGTLGNPKVYCAQTGLFKNTKVLQLPSPYKQDLGVFQINGLTSKFTERDETMFERYVKTIKTICETTDVNIGLYVTSYSFLEKLFDHGLDHITTPIFKAEKWMKSNDTDEMILEFRNASKRGGALLCSVMGGRSSEGTDFPGKDMEIIIIAGVPYPPKSTEQQAKFDYYSKRTKAAWNVCYTTPAFRQINQAAGRAIRSLQDRALIFLLDDRISKNKSRLTGWMRSGFETIESSEIEIVIGNYFN